MKNLVWTACAFAMLASAQPQEVVLHNFGSLPADRMARILMPAWSAMRRAISTGQL